MNDTTIDYDKVDAIINIANAARLVQQPASDLLKAAMPDVELKPEEIDFLASLGKLREVSGIKPDELTFRVNVLRDDDGTSRIDMNFGSRDFGYNNNNRVIMAVREEIIDQAKRHMEDTGHELTGSITFRGSSKPDPYWVGTQDTVTGAIASQDNGELLNFPVSDAAKVIDQIAARTAERAKQKLDAARQAMRGSA